jgi:hypothetical protein
MGLPFFSGYTGDPINMKRQVAAQATRGLPATAAFRDFTAAGGPLAISPQVIERLAINPGGAPLVPLVGKTNLGGGPLAPIDVDPNDYGLIHFLANLFGKYAVANVTGAAERWRFALDKATPGPGLLSMRGFNDVIPETRFHDLLIGGAEIVAAPGENFAVQFPFVFGGYYFGGVAEQETGAASTLPVLRKTWPGNWAEDDDADIWIKFLTDNADGTWEVQAGLGSSTVEPTFSDTRTLTEGVWFRLHNTDGSRIGVKAEQPEAFVPVGATLAELDVFRIPKRATPFTPALGASQAISSVNTSFILDGEETRVEGGWTVSLAWDTLEARPDTAGRQSATVRRAGQLRAIVTPTRDLVDLTLQQALHERQPISVVIDAETDVMIGATALPYRILVVLPACTPRGDLFDAEAGAANRDESLELVAGDPDATFTYDGLDFDSHAEIVVVNGRSAL